MPTRALIIVLLACSACHICTPDGETKCNGATLETCRDGDKIEQSCLDAGVNTCHSTPDGGATC